MEWAVVFQNFTSKGRVGIKRKRLGYFLLADIPGFLNASITILITLFIAPKIVAFSV